MTVWHLGWKLSSVEICVCEYVQNAPRSEVDPHNDVNISVQFISGAEPTSYDRHRDYANDDVDDDDDDYGAVPNVFL